MRVISDFFNTYLGMYIVQSVLHSLAAAAVADGSMLAWRINDPIVKQRLRVMVILLPIFSFPAYQAVNSSRGSLSFRLEALFDINRWLNLELWGSVPLWPFLVFALVVTALVFLIQEMIPVIRHTVESVQSSPEVEGPTSDPAVREALEVLPGETPPVFIIDEEEPVLFSSTRKDPAVFLSAGLMREFGPDQLQAALAHEIAHIKRSRRPLVLLVFLLRVLMFYNPVALIEFRKIVQEEEKICDDIAVSMTRKPKALAEVIDRLRPGAEKLASAHNGKLSGMTDSLEQFSHDMLLQGRIARLEHETEDITGNGWIQFAVSVVVTVVLNYFIV